MDFLYWTSQDVAQWMECIGFSQYKACFTENFITGRKLIYVNCSYLPRLGINDFQHMKVISAHIRELLGISDVQWSRSVADAPEDDMSVFLKMKSCTGQRAESITYDQIKNICLK
nr:sterile alpha motif domain-containing protein 15-like [Misgurnus anguillicaudatus]